jgi:hypothetical protein
MTRERRTSVEDVILQDDLEAYQRLLAEQHSMMKEHQLKCFGHINLAAHFGSIRIFKFLMLGDPLPELYANQAIVGGNIEIVRLGQQNKIDVHTEECLCQSVSYHRHDLYDWILESNPKFEPKLVVQFASSNSNAYVLLTFLSNSKFSNFLVICAAPLPSDRFPVS